MIDAAPPPAPSRRWLLYAPLGAVTAGGAVFYAMLRGLGTGSYDPRGVPSALIGRPVPDFSLPAVAGVDVPGLSAADLRGFNRPVVVNFWASWCVPCVIEHPQLMRLARDGVPVIGINYKDRAENARGFLARHGNPFIRLGQDEPGRVAIDWGLYGVPETYVIDRQGIIRWRWAGAVTPEILDRDIATLLRRYA